MIKYVAILIIYHMLMLKFHVFVEDMTTPTPNPWALTATYHFTD